MTQVPLHTKVIIITLLTPLKGLQLASSPKNSQKANEAVQEKAH